MKSVAIVGLVLAARALAAAAPPGPSSDPPLPKELWEKKVSDEVAAFRHDSQEAEKQTRQLRNDILRLAQRVARDRPEDIAPLRGALAAWEREGLDEQAVKLAELFAGSRGGLDDLHKGFESAERFRAALRKVVAPLTADPRVEVLRGKVQRLERGGGEKELAAARRELFDALAPLVRDRCARALNRQLRVNEETGALVAAAAKSPAGAGKREFLERAGAARDGQKEVAKEVESLVNLLEGDAALRGLVDQARKASAEAERLLANGAAGEECVKAQADAAAALARATALIKLPPDRPLLGVPGLAPQHRNAAGDILAGLEALEQRAERQADAVRRLREETTRRLISELGKDSDEPKKP